MYVCIVCDRERERNRLCRHVCDAMLVYGGQSVGSSHLV